LNETTYLIPEDLHARMVALGDLRRKVRDEGYETGDVYTYRRDAAQLLRDLKRRRGELGCFMVGHVNE